MKSIVSVIMPCYNAAKSVSLTLQSILSQTHTALEIIVIDDGSTDGSSEIIKSFADDRIKYFYQPNKGQCAALNHGFSRSVGSLIKFYDADDILHPLAIESQVQALQNAAAFDLSFIEWRRFYNDVLPAQIDETDPHTIHRTCTPLEYIMFSGTPPMYQCGLWLIPRALIEKAGPWAEHLSVINDTEFFSRLLSNAGILYFSNVGYTLYRTNTGSNTLSSDFSAKGIRSAIKATDMAAQSYFSIERSGRINRLVVQSYLLVLDWAYPTHKLYSKIIINRIRSYSSEQIKLGKSGILYNLLVATFGWRFAKQLAAHYYKVRYNR